MVIHVYRENLCSSARNIIFPAGMQEQSSVYAKMLSLSCLHAHTRTVCASSHSKTAFEVTAIMKGSILH